MLQIRFIWLFRPNRESAGIEYENMNCCETKSENDLRERETDSCGFGSFTIINNEKVALMRCITIIINTNIFCAFVFITELHQIFSGSHLKSSYFFLCIILKCFYIIDVLHHYI